MIRPPRGCCAFITRKAFWMHRKAPVRLTSITWRQASYGEVFERHARHVRTRIVEQEVDPSEALDRARRTARGRLPDRSRRSARPEPSPPPIPTCVATASKLRRGARPARSGSRASQAPGWRPGRSLCLPRSLSLPVRPSDPPLAQLRRFVGTPRARINQQRIRRRPLAFQPLRCQRRTVIPMQGRRTATSGARRASLGRHANNAGGHRVLDPNSAEIRVASVDRRGA